MVGFMTAIFATDFLCYISFWFFVFLSLISCVHAHACLLSLVHLRVCSLARSRAHAGSLTCSLSLSLYIYIYIYICVCRIIIPFLNYIFVLFFIFIEVVPGITTIILITIYFSVMLISVQ